MPYDFIERKEYEELLKRVAQLEREVQRLKGEERADVCKMKEAEKIFQLSSSEIRKMIDKGKIKSATQITERGDWFFSRSELITLANNILKGS